MQKTFTNGNANTHFINNRDDENTAEPLKCYENRLKNRIQLTSISVGTEGKKQDGTIQLSKLQGVPKVAQTVS